MLQSSAKIRNRTHPRFAVNEGPTAVLPTDEEYELHDDRDCNGWSRFIDEAFGAIGHGYLPVKRRVPVPSLKGRGDTVEDRPARFNVRQIAPWIMACTKVQSDDGRKFDGSSMQHSVVLTAKIPRARSAQSVRLDDAFRDLIAVRVVGIGRASINRTLWIQDLFKGDLNCIDDHWQYTPNDARCWSQAQRGFDMLFMHSGRPETLVPVLDEARMIFPRKPIVAFTEVANSHWVAALLDRGFDDVFTAEMKHREACTRVRAIWRRTRSNLPDAIRGASGPATNFVESGCRLSDPQLQILTILTESFGKFVSISHIFDCLGKREASASRRVLYVQISRLRRALVSEFGIDCSRVYGYQLRRRDGLSE